MEADPGNGRVGTAYQDHTTRPSDARAAAVRAARPCRNRGAESDEPTRPHAHCCLGQRHRRGGAKARRTWGDAGRRDAHRFRSPEAQGQVADLLRSEWGTGGAGRISRGGENPRTTGARWPVVSPVHIRSLDVVEDLLRKAW